MASLSKLAVYCAGFAVILYFTKRYFGSGECWSSTQRMDNKVIIVTGSNTGIGKATVQDLVTRGAKVYMACRSLGKAETAANVIIKETGVAKDLIVLLELDLSSYDSVRKFAKEFKNRESRLDVLINNAGVWMPERQLTVDGNEMTFGTNHLGHFLLTNLLLDILSASSPSRIVTVSSEVHQHIPNGTLDLEDPNSVKDYHHFNAYANSKLANIMFSRELGKRMKGTGVTTYSLHPGCISTEIARSWSFFHNPFFSIMACVSYLFLKLPMQGAQTQICCAVDPALSQETALYYSECKVTATLPVAEDGGLCKELWDFSVAMVKLQPEEMMKHVNG